MERGNEISILNPENCAFHKTKGTTANNIKLAWIMDYG